MKEMVKKNPGMDWGVVAGILFWFIIIATFITLISFGRTKIPHPVLEVTEVSASRNNLTIAHRKGDPIRLANTKCIWTPDISDPDVIQDAGSLVSVGKESKEGRVSKLEPTEAAELEKKIKMKVGSVGRILIIDAKSSLQIYSRTVKIAK